MSNVKVITDVHDLFIMKVRGTSNFIYIKEDWNDPSGLKLTYRIITAEEIGACVIGRSTAIERDWMQQYVADAEKQLGVVIEVVKIKSITVIQECDE